MKAIAIVAGAALLSLGLVGTASAGGAELYVAKGCSACHGADGNTPIMPTYPKVAGQNAGYALNQIKDIKSGARANGQAMAMKGLVATVPDAELKEISDWLATQ
ncbi:MAG: c-type cytochrome [Sedimenticola sp.]